MGASRAGIATLACLLVLASSLPFAASGCSSARDLRTYDSVVSAGLVSPSLLPPRPPPERDEARIPVSAWAVEDARDMADLGDKLVALLEKRDPKIVAFGELYTPWWVPEYSASTQLARHFLPKVASRLGFRDLVCEYLTQDVPDDDLAAAYRGDPAPAVEGALLDFYATDLAPASHELKVRLHRGGYARTLDRSWTLDDLAVRGAPSAKSLRPNPHYVDIAAEIKRNSLEKILRLRSEGRRVLWFGGAEIAEVEPEIDFLTAPAFKSDWKRYVATRDAGAMGADLRALGLDREYAVVLVLPPTHIQHQGRLNEAQYERMWRLKKKTPRLCWRTVGGSIKIVLLLPYEKHRITNMESKVRASDED